MVAVVNGSRRDGVAICGRCGKEFEQVVRRGPVRKNCETCQPPRLARKPVAKRKRAAVGVPFTVEHFRAWSARFKLKDGTPFVLDGYQALFLEDLFARDEDGLPVFSELWLIVPEGNGKTTFFTLVALYVIEHVPEAWVPVAASARDQAVDLTYRLAAGFVTRNRRDPDFRLHPGYRQIVHKGSRGSLKIFASDAASGDGVDPTLAIIEELHRLARMDLYETWAGKLDKSDGQLIVASTAGEPGGAFEELRERIRQSAHETTRGECFVRAVAAGVVLHEYALPEGADPQDLELVAKANPFSGKTVEQLAKKRAKPSYNLPHWLRFTCNQPSRAAEAAITEQTWDRQRADDLIPDGEAIWCGADFGWSHDTTAIVPFYMPSMEHRQFGPAAIIEPPDDGGMTHPDTIKMAFRDIHERNPIEVVVMDMTSAEDIAAWLEDELGCQIVNRSQGNPLKALDYERFTEALRQRWLWHSGDDGLRRHVLNAVARVLPGGETRFARPRQSRQVSQATQRSRVIDALDAAAMVHTSAVGELGDNEDLIVAFIDVPIGRPW